MKSTNIDDAIKVLEDKIKKLEELKHKQSFGNAFIFDLNDDDEISDMLKKFTEKFGIYIYETNSSGTFICSKTKISPINLDKICQEL